MPTKITVGRGITVAVRSGGGEAEREWQYGSVSTEKGSLFELGSLTKLFTATVLLELERAGKCSVYDRVAKYLPEIVPAACNVTLLDLVTHRAGLPRLPKDIRPLDRDPYAGYDRGRLMQFLKTTTWRLGGESAFLYSNLGYATLGIVLESAGNACFEDLLRRYVLVPFGLRQLGFPPMRGSSRGEIVQGHSEAGFRVQAWEFAAFAPCGALVGTAEDVGKFVKGINHDKYLTRAFMPVAEAGRGEIAFGWLLQAGGKVAWHNGATNGFSSYASLELETGKWLVLLANRYMPEISSIGHELERLYYFQQGPERKPKNHTLRGLFRDGLVGTARILGAAGWKQAKDRLPT